jgi:hypothetical protein
VRRNLNVKGYTVKIRPHGNLFRVHAERPDGTTFNHYPQSSPQGAALRAYRMVKQIEEGKLK